MHQMAVFRVVLGSAAVLMASACIGSNEIDSPSPIELSNGGSTSTGIAPTTTTGAPSTTGGDTAGSDASSMGGATVASTSGTGTTTSTDGATPTTSGTSSTTTGVTTGASTSGGAAGGSTGMGGASTTGGFTNTSGNAFGGAANDAGGADSTTGAGSGTGGQTSSDQCRLMLGDVPVCCTPTGENRSNVDEVFELLNTYRNSQGRDALAQDPILEETMQGHCMHMDQADFFDHISPVAELAQPWDRADLCGTNANAENIAWNQRSPSEVMTAWQNSSGHNQNMLTNNSTRVGIGEYNLYWGQIFGP